jgi:hypothetical protein
VFRVVVFAVLCGIEVLVSAVGYILEVGKLAFLSLDHSMLLSQFFLWEKSAILHLSAMSFLYNICYKIAYADIFVPNSNITQFIQLLLSAIGCQLPTHIGMDLLQETIALRVCLPEGRRTRTLKIKYGCSNRIEFELLSLCHRAAYICSYCELFIEVEDEFVFGDSCGFSKIAGLGLSGAEG